MRPLVLICLTLAAAVSADFSFEETLYDVIQKVPEQGKERIKFLRYHIQRGHELYTKRNDKKYNITENFSLILYKYAQEHHAIQEEDLLRQLRQIICFDDGTCIDIGDIGVHP